MNNALRIIREFIMAHQAVSIGIAVVCFLAAGFILRKVKLLAIALILVASLIMYSQLQSGKFKVPDMKKLKDSAREHIMQKIK